MKMITLAWVLFAVMATISALHFYWAFGGLWPASTVEDLARTVVGTPDHPYMPGAALTFVVSVLIFAGGLIPVLHVTGSPVWLPRIVTTAGLVVLTLVFLGRGLGTYLVPSMLENAAEPFRTLNFRFFSPLCVVLGVGYAVFLTKS